MNPQPSGDGGARLALAGVAALALGLLWLAGALSAALFGGGWAAIPAAQTIAVAIHLPSHLGDPRAAWPVPTRRSLPDALGFYLTLGLLLCALAFLTLWANRLAQRIGPALKGAGTGRRPASARWASARDLRRLVVRGPERGRLVLGHHGRRLLAAEQRASVIVVAPAQSGKTTGLAIPALREWDGPVLATSVKNDLLLDTYDHRDRIGRAMVFDPVGASDFVESVSANPLRGCDSWEGALRVAHWLSSAAHQGDGLSDSEFWYAAAEKLLAPLLYAAALKRGSIGTVVGWLDKGMKAKAEVEAALAKGENEAVAAKLAWQANWNREERQRSSIYTTAETITAAFADPRVQRACRRDADGYSPDALLGKSNTLYLCAPAHEQKRLRPLFSMMIRELVSVVYEQAARREGPIDPPLLLVLDELANVAPVPGLDEIASTGAGQGIQLLSVFQDLAQVRARYGDGAHTIVNNHRAKLFGTGVSDPETLSFVSGVVGAGEFRHESATADDRGSSARTEGSIYRELTPANVVREGEPGSALLLYGHLPPTRIRLRQPSKRGKLDRSSADDQRPGRPSKGKAEG